VKSVLCRNWVFGPCYVNDLAFRGVKFHVPCMTPAFKVVNIVCPLYLLYSFFVIMVKYVV